MKTKEHLELIELKIKKIAEWIDDISSSDFSCRIDLREIEEAFKKELEKNQEYE